MDMGLFSIALSMVIFFILLNLLLHKVHLVLSCSCSCCNLCPSCFLSWLRRWCLGAAAPGVRGRWGGLCGGCTPRVNACWLYSWPCRPLSAHTSQLGSGLSCAWLCNSMDCSPPGSSAHGSFHQEYWSRLLFSTPGDLPNPGIEPASLGSPALVGGFFTTLPPGSHT